MDVPTVPQDGCTARLRSLNVFENKFTKQLEFSIICIRSLKSNFPNGQKGAPTYYWVKNSEKLRQNEENLPLADLGGGARDARPPLGVQILSFSCSFQQIIRKIIDFWELAPPPGENPGSATVYRGRVQNVTVWIRH